MNKANLLAPNFASAKEDYRLLLERDYPVKPALALVGDRYRLTRALRMVLFRGVLPRLKAKGRKDKLLPLEKVRDQVLLIDGFNVLLTVFHYRKGDLCFIAEDGFLRDIGGAYGHIKHPDLFLDSIEHTLAALQVLGPKFLRMVLDRPVSHSGDYAKHITQSLAGFNLQGECLVVDYADQVLKEAKEGILATSDSVIIDSAYRPFFDLGRFVIENSFPTNDSLVFL